MEDPKQAVETLRASIANAAEPMTYALADQVVTQLLHSMGGETVHGVVSDLRHGEDGLMGRVVLFTERLLVIAKIVDAPHQTNRLWSQPVKWSTTVTLHSRAALSRIEVLSPEEPDALVDDWSHLTSGTRVVLHYEGLEEPTIEVTSRNTRSLEALLALLCTDVKRI